MFEQLRVLPVDPILGLMTLFKQDQSPDKVDLGAGVFKNDEGLTPILQSVREAEMEVIDKQQTKVYLAQAGDELFNQNILELVLGEAHPALMNNRVTSIQTPGGCGALWALAQLIRRSKEKARIWLSDPTWANHIPIMSNSGLSIERYPYYQAGASELEIDFLLASLSKASAGDVVLFHGCCHNPCGMDLSREQWHQVTELAQQVGFVPLIDIAYQGFGSDTGSDAYGVRLMAEQLPEVLIASSCSKNFGLYRERTGAAVLVGRSEAEVAAARSQVLAATRAGYTMAPAHGALIVAQVLSNPQRKQLWLEEVGAMCKQINGTRSRFVEMLNKKGAGGRFDMIEKQNGMFSFLGISTDQIQRLQQEFSIYMVDSSRINIAGITESNIDYVTDSIMAVL